MQDRFVDSAKYLVPGGRGTPLVPFTAVMPNAKKMPRRVCKVCGVSGRDVHVSSRYLCVECAIARSERAGLDMQDPTSEQSQRWRVALIEALLGTESKT